MQTLAASKSATAFAVSAKQSRAVRVCAQASKREQIIDRRAAVAFLLTPTLLTARAAFAEGQSPKAERRAALSAAVKEIKDTGEDRDAFPESNYTVGEDKSPNVHTRQEEGMRKS